MGRGTDVKVKPADTLKELDEVMADFCVRDENTGELKLLQELPVITMHRGKWSQVISPCAGTRGLVHTTCSLIRGHEH